VERNTEHSSLNTEHSLPTAILRTAGTLELKLSSDFGDIASDKSENCCRHSAIGVQRSL